MIIYCTLNSDLSQAIAIEIEADADNVGEAGQNAAQLFIATLPADQQATPLAVKWWNATTPETVNNWSHTPGDAYGQGAS